MGTRDEGLDDGAPAGGVGTITRPAQAPDTDPAARPQGLRNGNPGTEAPSRVPPPRTGRRGTVRPASQDADTQAPGPGRTLPRTAPGAGPGPSGEPRHTQRMPFFLLVCCLLGGALVSALVISTTLAAGSFEITKLQQANSSLATQRQRLQEAVAAAQSAQVIEQRALQLGMRPVGELRFLDLKTGKIETDAGSGAVAAIHVPGYTP